MVLEGKYAKQGFLLSSAVLGINVVSHLYLKDSGEDVIGYMYTNLATTFNSQSGTYLEKQLKLLWVVITAITLQSSMLRVMTSFLLLVGVIKQDPVLRLPWIILSMLEVQGNACLISITWVLLIFHCQLAPVQGLSVLIILTVLYLRLAIWENMCWFTLNDIVSVVSWVAQHQAGAVNVTVSEKTPSTTTSDFELEILFDDATPDDETPGTSDDATPDDATPGTPDDVKPDDETPGTSDDATPDDATPGTSDDVKPDDETPGTPDDATPDDESPGTPDDVMPDDATPGTPDDGAGPSELLVIVPPRF